MRTAIVATGMVFSMLSSAAADPIGYDIEWVGSGGYTMTGMFTFDDSLINTGPITAGSMQTFMIEGFLNGVSIGTWDLADGQGTGAGSLNINFDTTTEEFLVGGFSGTPNGQRWNWQGTPGLGFVSSLPGQAFSLDGVFVPASTINTADSTLVATRKTQTVPEPPATVPEPASLLLWGMLGAVGAAVSWRRRRAVRRAESR